MTQPLEASGAASAAPDPFNPATNPDAQEALSHKHTGRRIQIMLLSSGKVAIFNSKFELLDIVANDVMGPVGIYMEQAFKTPLPEYQPPSSPLSGLDGLPELSIRI